MTKSHTTRDESLDDETLALLGSAPGKVMLVEKRKANLRAKVLQQIDSAPLVSAPFVTIRADEGSWIELEPLLEKKVLNVDPETGVESYLLRLHPGAAPSQHLHDEDELCVVLEGAVSFDDIHLFAGDYHLARKGSLHGRASSVHGALLFLQSNVSAMHA